MTSFFSTPKPKDYAAEQAKMEAEAEKAAQAERDKNAMDLKKGRVQTVLTSGQGLEEDPTKKRNKKTILGG